MRARIAFYFAAIVALVLFLAAAVPSHATQHRDPALTTPELTQRRQPTGPAHSPDSTAAAKPRGTTKTPVKAHSEPNSKKTAKRASPSKPKGSDGLSDRTASSMGTK